MSEKPFVINDRRKFTAEGELRHDLPPTDKAAEAQPAEAQPAEATRMPPAAAEVPQQPTPEAPKGPQPVAAAPESIESEPAEDMPPPPTAEQSEQATRAYDATVDRLDTALRAADPGGDRMPEMNFDRLVQSIYMQTILQLGGAAERGQQPQVDLLGARQSIDMLGVIAEKSKGNLTDAEQRLLDSALFEMRMGFLDVTQALARQAQSRQSGPPAPGNGPMGPMGPTGPRIVR